MDCKVRHIGDITILDLNGRLSLGEALASSPRGGRNLNETICKLAEEGHKKVVLNLAGVTQVDSSGVGQLIGAYTSGRNQSVDLKLLKPTQQVRAVLEMTKLDSVFDIKDDEAAAIASFSKGAAAGT